MSAPLPKTWVQLFPFDLFGSSGTAAGAELLGDAIREMLDDNRRETIPTRSVAYQSHIKIHEQLFETIDDLQQWRGIGKRLARKRFQTNDRLLWITGNHLGALPVLESLPPQTTVFQWDAHLDIYTLHDSTPELSHGNFLLELPVGTPEIIQIGHRDLFLSQEMVATRFHERYPAPEMHLHGEQCLHRLRAASQRAEKIWVDIDCDAIDPATFPAVLQPQPFGLSSGQLWQSLGCLDWNKVIGISLSEFAPARDQNDQSLALLIWLIEAIFLLWYEK
ncbi:arginase family protein [Tuwongella immobilis]|uniref:Arginase n=1 Tax=Tuwongella immobilis TaxID=692036 RepID=A0A6C2YNT4_9BACT|nr:arginase family protein [Tuwongella immobilis]VIP02715.1 agmatinase : Putative agmatinase (SpeB) OS=uncultured marine thaumarchaeote KM3_11_E10 GN=speB PE=3 SV=1: Arginase [Tuwongella immobilis]VTS02236.1 agmatinase : Putative agmatinase (SpeB) OS=uncultured marine thaumarchaeote KM3_11_E10 GN=speB PE=3 SV=1: Arginase [Tuwongella immobilis]